MPHTKAGLFILGAFDFLAISFASAILAALSAALLFVRGVIVGAATLLGRGFGFSGFAGDVGREILATDLALGFTPLEFVFVARRTEDERVPATDAGRVRLFRLESEGVRVGAGLWWRTDYTVRTRSGKDAGMNSQLEGGWVLSFIARSAALRLVLGRTVGAFVLATEMVSLRLCPGTPSKVPSVTRLVRAGVSLVELRTGFGGGCCPSLREAARVMRGAITGGAVEATTIVSARLCPGTFAKVFAKASLLRGRRGPEGFCSTDTPARRAAALVVRGAMSGLMCVEGIGLALNEGRDRLVPPTVDGFVVVDWGYPASEEPDSCSARRTEESTDRMEPLSGRSATGKGGEEANRDAI